MEKQKKCIIVKKLKKEKVFMGKSQTTLIYKNDSSNIIPHFDRGPKGVYFLS